MPPATKPSAKEAAGLGQINTVTTSVAAVLTVGLILGLYYILWYSPSVEQADRERQRTVEVQTQNQRSQLDLRRYNADVADLVRSRSRSRELRRILPESADIPGLMRSINQLAEGSGLQIALIQPEDERTEQYYVRIPVRLEVVGNYLALARFFRAISTLPRVINMENIALEIPPEQSGDVKLHAKVLATTFRSLAASEVTSARPGTTATAGGSRR